MSSRINIVITFLLIACAMLLVNSQYQARRLFIELERASTQTRQLEVEWAQLQLDQSTLAKHARIESIAHNSLKMQRASAGRTQYLAQEAQ